MKKKFLALVLALVMTLTLLPVTAMAAATPPILYYDGNRVQVGDTVTGDTGTATFTTDSNGGVLTLDNFTDAPTSGGFSAYNNNLKVVLKGTNSLTVQPGQYQGYSAIALTSRDHALTIVGENAATDTLTATVTSNNSAIYSYGGTTIENAGITASLTGTYDGHMYAIDEMYGDVTIRNSSVIATVENTAYSWDAAAIYVNSGSVIIDNSDVEVEATSRYNAKGLDADRDLIITDSAVKAEASGYCTNAIRAGFNACVITDSTVEVTAGGDSGYGFAYMYGPTIGGDSTVTITSVESAERACYGKPTLTDYYIVKAGADAASAQVVADPNADDNEYYLQKYVQIKTSVNEITPPAPTYPLGDTIVDLGDDSITVATEDGKEVVKFDTADAADGFFYYTELVPVNALGGMAVAETYVDLYNSAATKAIVDVAGGDVTTDHMAAMQVAGLSVKDPTLHNPWDLEAEQGAAMAIILKLHKDNYNYDSSLGITPHVYAVYGVHAEIVTPSGTTPTPPPAGDTDTPTPPPATDTPTPPPADDTDKPESEKPVIKPTTPPSYDPTPVIPPVNVDVHDDTLYDAAQAVYAAVKSGKADFTPIGGYTKEEVIQMQKDDALKLVVEKKRSYDPAEKALIDKAVEEKVKGALVQFLEIDVTLRTMADVIVAEVDDTILDLSITVDLDDEMKQAAKDGKTIYVARAHDGKVAFLEGKLNADKTKVTFDSSKFSTYALVAFDSKVVTAPQTADAGIILAVSMSILSVTGSAMLLKKKED